MSLKIDDNIFTLYIFLSKNLISFISFDNIYFKNGIRPAAKHPLFTEVNEEVEYAEEEEEGEEEEEDCEEWFHRLIRTMPLTEFWLL